MFLRLVFLLIYISILSAKFDVVVVSHYKDYETLPLCIESIKKNVVGCDRIFVIGNKEISGDFIYVPESKFYKFINPHDMKKQWEVVNKETAPRAFWIFQQLLKMGAFLIIEGLSENYLHVDADSVFVKPCSFLTEEGKILYNKHPAVMCGCCPNGWPHLPYLRSYIKIMGQEPPVLRSFSFITHHLLWNQCKLASLFDHIEKIHQKSWYQAIFDCVDFNQISSVSEPDLYGNWLWQNYKDELVYRPLKWADLNYMPNLLTDQSSYDFVSAHWYLRHNSVMGLPD